MIGGPRQLDRDRRKGEAHFDLVYKARGKFAIGNIRRGALQMRDSLFESPDEIIEALSEVLAEAKADQQSDAPHAGRKQHHGNYS